MRQLKSTVLRFKRAYWDGDGTLVDTESLGKEAFLEVGKDYGLRMTEEEFDATTGWNAKDRYQMVVDEGRFTRSVPDEATWMKRLKTYQAMNSHKITVMPGVAGMMRLMQENGMGQALVTNARKSSSATKINALGGLQQLLEFRFTAADPQPKDSPFPKQTFGIIARGKPDPEGYNKARSRGGDNRMQGIAFEDSPAGVEAAHAAGMMVVQIQSDPSQFSDLATIRVDSLGNKRDFDKVAQFMGLRYDPSRRLHQDNRISKIEQPKAKPVKQMARPALGM